MTFPQVKFKRVLDRNDGGTWGDDPVGSGDTVVLRSTEQTADGRWAIKEPELRFVAPQEAERYLLRKGDLLITKSSGSALHIGKTTIVDSTVANLRAIYSNFMQRVRLSGSESPKYFWYVLRTPWIREQWVLNSTSTTGLANLNADSIGQLLVPHPPLDEQRQIAEYLDRETGKIDELIAKQEQLVENVQQRRRSVIFHLITKGTNPSAPLKPAPFIWWGQIPEHWTMPKVSFHYSVVLGKMLDAARSDKPGDILMPYIRAGNIQEAGLDLGDLNEMPFSPDEVTALDLRTGDLLVVEGGAVGVNYLISEPIEDVSFQKTVNRVRAVDRSSTRFLGYALDVLRSTGVIDMLCNKSTIAHLTADKLGRINIPYPPVGEQEKIVELLELETAKLDQLASSARNVINVLHERRAALISAAVTGKIDVRGL